LSNNRVFIIGGGPSLFKFNFSKLVNEDVIAVNGSIFNLPRAKFFLTMDYSFLSKSGIAGPRVRNDRFVLFVSSPSEKVFVVGHEEGRFIKENDSVVIDTFTKIRYNLCLFNTVVFAAGRGGVGLSFDDFRSSSDSGYSAIQLAVLKKYNEVYLMGFDFTTEGSKTHYHNIYGGRCPVAYRSRLDWFLTEYERLFREIREKTGVKVFSCSKISKLNGLIPYVDIGTIV
jgi:hypothetical protein